MTKFITDLAQAVDFLGVTVRLNLPDPAGYADKFFWEPVLPMVSVSKSKAVPNSATFSCLKYEKKTLALKDDLGETRTLYYWELVE